MNDKTLVQPLTLDKFHRVPMSLTNRNWWVPVPNITGWYAIETNTPVSVLAKLPPPKPGKRYNLGNRIRNASFLISVGLAIQPLTESANYIVYIGEHENLKSRAREHTHGHTGTGCLCLSDYPELWKYDWEFLYMACSEHAPTSQGDKALRIFLEQRWRGENTWPLLCHQ
ncbi:MAG: hypothetical protein HXX12_14025 [Geothrix sp.]|uniref:hypothetical protein n=1 Tax=Geothrix sp. TaxID=1962974 RepID=UPI0017CF1FA9|nr:hypothetical protein [Geothrix sp.]NWJ42076.1 hypothetical protein [Geothrix sp.]WIL19956.1 MAG: hypothetical protein QOZ81_002495 [Geothrix sp.]